MYKVTYEYLFGNEPLFPTYMQLQMADQSIRFLERIVKDVMVKIQDHHAPADFMVLKMGEDEEDTPIILGRPFLNTTNAIIYVGSGQIHFQFPGEKVRVTSIVIPLMNSQKSPAPRGDVDHPNTRNQPPRNEWGKMKN
jgi:hypothetical protein